ncbi:MAG: molecular chaperone DnaK, partial [Pseudomonadota bacterium]
KSLEDHGDKVDPSTVEAIELAVTALEEVMDGDDAGKIKSGIQNVTEAAMRLGEAIYKAQADETGGEAEMDDPDAPRDADDDILDADFEDLDDDQKRA